MVAEQDALRQKASVEAEALRKRTQIETEAQAARLRNDAELDEEKRNSELELLKQKDLLTRAQGQLGVEKAEADARLVKAQAQTKEMTILAEGELAQNRAKAAAITPLTVEQAGYSALQAFAGSGATVYLGDWSRVPNFLFPHQLVPGQYALTPPTLAAPKR
jgi:hypothetical protein